MTSLGAKDNISPNEAATKKRKLDENDTSDNSSFEQNAEGPQTPEPKRRRIALENKGENTPTALEAYSPNGETTPAQKFRSEEECLERHVLGLQERRRERKLSNFQYDEGLENLSLFFHPLTSLSHGHYDPFPDNDCKSSVQSSITPKPN